jgi:hypothetical protein
MIYTKEPYIKEKNVVCEKLCCAECMRKILQRTKENKNDNT